MTNLVPASPPSLPTPCPPGIDRAVSYLTNKLVPAGTAHELPSSEAPTAEQRRGLERRLSRLDDWLAPFASDDEQGVRDELYALLSTRKGEMPVNDARAIVAIYLADLRDLPLHAIRAACLDFRHDRVPGDKGFRPTQGEIRRQAQIHMHALAVEQRRIRTILDAKLVDHRPSAETRRATAAAARRAFGLPEGGLGSGQVPHAQSDGAGSLAETARELFLNSSVDAWRRKQAAKDGAAYPEDRFDDEHAA